MLRMKADTFMNMRFIFYLLGGQSTPSQTGNLYVHSATFLSSYLFTLVE